MRNQFTRAERCGWHRVRTAYAVDHIGCFAQTCFSFIFPLQTTIDKTRLKSLTENLYTVGDSLIY